jgi:hypothetical protein
MPLRGKLRALAINLVPRIPGHRRASSLSC